MKCLASMRSMCSRNVKKRVMVGCVSTLSIAPITNWEEAPHQRGTLLRWIPVLIKHVRQTAQTAVPEEQHLVGDNVSSVEVSQPYSWHVTGS